MAIIILMFFGLFSVILFSYTGRPKLAAVINGLLGVAALILTQLLAYGDLARVNFCNTALSVITGIPGAILTLIFSVI